MPKEKVILTGSDRKEPAPVYYQDPVMPVFTIKGKDQFAVPTIRFWLSLAARKVNVQKLKRAINDLEIIENYQEERYRLPD